MERVRRLPRELRILLSRYASEEKEINACQINQGDILWISQLGPFASSWLWYVEQVDVLQSQVVPILVKGRLDYTQTCMVRIQAKTGKYKIAFDGNVNFDNDSRSVLRIMRLYSLPYSDEVRTLLQV